MRISDWSSDVCSSDLGETVVDADEYPRHGVTAESLAGLRPAFDKEGSVPAGNASGINDGAAAVVLMSADDAAKPGVKPLDRIVSWASCAVDPVILGPGPIPVLGTSSCWDSLRSVV